MIMFCKYAYIASPLSYFQCLLEISPGALKAIAEIAIERKTGARGLRSILVRDFDYYLFCIVTS